MVIGKMSFAVEIDGRAVLVALPKDHHEKELLLILMQSAMGGEIVTKDAPANFSFMEV